MNGRGQRIKWIKDKRTKGQTMIYNTLDDGLFHFRLELPAFSVAIILYIYTIKTNTITGRVGVYMQIVGLYVIDS
jgi:hypothetical protein